MAIPAGNCSCAIEARMIINAPPSSHLKEALPRKTVPRKYGCFPRASHSPIRMLKGFSAGFGFAAADVELLLIFLRGLYIYKTTNLRNAFLEEHILKLIPSIFG